MKKHKGFILLLFGAFFYFWLRGAISLDADFGWHLRLGEFIAQSGVPRTDPFSYTMPSYPVISHEWLVDRMIAAVYPFIGYSGIAGVFSLFAVGALWFSLQTVAAARKEMWFPFLLVVGSLGIFVGNRPQVVTWFLFAFVLWIVRDAHRFIKWQYLLPLLFLLWANVHGGFVLGLVILTVSTGYWLVQKKVSAVRAGGIVALSFLASGSTPYGFGMWQEVWTSMADPSLRFVIQEWMPAIFTFSLILWLFVVLSCFLVYRYRDRFSGLDLLLYGGLLLAGLSSVRHLPLWMLVALPLTIESLSFFIQDAQKITEGKRRLSQAFRLLLVISMLFFLPDAFAIIRGISGGYDAKYPIQAVTFLQDKIPTGEIFVPYNWGGYLLWQLPEKRVFVDGRMPSWRMETNSAKESAYAFGEYRAFLEQKVSFTDTTKKYGITTLVLPITRELDPLTQWSIFISNKVFALPLSERALMPQLEKAAQKAGWKRVYKDTQVVIYQDTTHESVLYR
ncbi:MAG: hypothetical protein AAB553_04550 [Patescibacteria group bacterium]